MLVPGTATESAADDATTRSARSTITKSEPSPEGELLRGVHDHPTVYTLRVRATDAAGTDGVVVTDYLPADLEFLGCGGEDFSAGPEYPGAPLLDGTPAVPGCVAPDTVDTVVDPPPEAGTTFPPGVYTRLRWMLGDLAAGHEVVLPYAAGVPLRANALVAGRHRARPRHRGGRARTSTTTPGPPPARVRASAPRPTGSPPPATTRARWRRERCRPSPRRRRRR